MTEPSLPDRRRVFTIGHSNHAEQVFLDLLRQHQIEVVADVRSQPCGELFDIGRIVDRGWTKRIGTQPESEDSLFHHSEARVLGDMPADEFWGLLQRLAEPKLLEILGRELMNKRHFLPTPRAGGWRDYSFHLRQCSAKRASRSGRRWRRRRLSNPGGVRAWRSAKKRRNSSRASGGPCSRKWTQAQA